MFGRLSRRRFRKLLSRRLAVPRGEHGLAGKYEKSVQAAVSKKGVLLTIRQPESKAGQVIRDLLAFAELVGLQTGYEYQAQEPPFYSHRAGGFLIFFHRVGRAVPLDFGNSGKAQSRMPEWLKECGVILLSGADRVASHPIATGTVIVTGALLAFRWFGTWSEEADRAASAGDMLVGFHRLLLFLGVGMVAAVLLFAVAAYGRSAMAQAMMERRHRRHQQDALDKADKSAQDASKRARWDLLKENRDDRPVNSANARRRREKKQVDE